MRKTAWILLGLALLLAPFRAEVEPAEPVLILLEEQLVKGPEGYPALVAEHDGARRLTLRKKITARLKAIAERTQPAVRKALGNPPGVQSFWILNALLLPLSPARQAKARALPGVRAVIPVAGLIGPGRPGKLAEVIRPRKRKSFSPRGREVGWNLRALRVPEVWTKLRVAGEGVVVASYDQGVNYRHADLRGNLWTNPDEDPENGRDDDGNGLVDDWYGWDFTRMRSEVLLTGQRQHGSYTGCLVVGDGSGGTVTGVAPRARLMSLVAFGGPHLAARAMEYAISEGADIMSMSFSIPDLGPLRGLWRLMAEHATLAGLVLVSGAGNFGKQVEVPVQIRIPEGIPCVICVGGVDRNLSVPDFVSQGPVEWADVPLYGDYPLPEGLVKPDVVAFPGPGLPLIGNEDEGYQPKGNGRRGNSLSAPQVAGVVALMLSVNPEITPWRVSEILQETARDLPPRGKDNATGAGLVDALEAVRQAKKE